MAGPILQSPSSFNESLRSDVANEDRISTSLDSVAPLEVSESLVPVREMKQAGTICVSLDGLLRRPIFIKEDLKEGCGGQLWPAGLLLAQYMVHEHRASLLGKTIIELGAGSGLVGLAVARGCSTNSPIFITDQECMLPLMKDNVNTNDLSSNARAIVLDWGSPLPDCIPYGSTVVLAADCVYFEPAFPLLISTLQQLLSPGSVCYFCFKRRRRADLRFMKQAKKIFDVAEIRGYMDHDNFARENLFLYSIRPRSAKNNITLLPNPC
ncbi:hypothetical protein Egran_06486 [Elaphomyces granulatus]|uniref:Protein-lysine N-methyltransferase EFM6 n=1 Tax=Elaphomyces granulatus TaxID=519963 RepID=A0A232LNM9_9EURO|nr:hypothetical protein Egran_06486 [Elaphomyces granulatus]